MAAPTTYRVTFDRIGRNHSVPPLDIKRAEPDADYLADAIFSYARKHLGSREVETYVGLSEDGSQGEGGILVGGFRPAGNFTITRLDGPQ